MTLFEVKNYDGHLYLKGELKAILGNKSVNCLANAKTITLFSKDTSLKEVQKSLSIVLQDIKLREESKESHKEE